MDDLPFGLQYNPVVDYLHTRSSKRGFHKHTLQINNKLTVKPRCADAINLFISIRILVFLLLAKFIPYLRKIIICVNCSIKN